MRHSYFLIFFLVVLFVHLGSLYTGNDTIAELTKPLLLVTLIVYFFSATHKVDSRLKKWVALALFFSLSGDILLLFVKNDPIFFIAGLASFLVAHFFYILFFHSIRTQETIEGKIWLLVIVFIYYALLTAMLDPWLGDLRLAVRIYSVVICFMLMLAMHMLHLKNKTAGRKLFFGALLFVMSDSLLAINKFYISFAAADILVMLTYGIAQLLMVQGGIEYITVSQDKKRVV